MKTLFVPILSAAVFAFACSSQVEKEVENLKNTVNRLETVEPSATDDFNDPFNLDTAFIRGTELWIAVSYSGGCREHQFLVEWPEVITFIYPPDFGVKLYHDGDDDMCEAYLSDTVKVDLKSTPSGNFDPETISKMRITVINGNNPEQHKSTR